ncbi:16S rRNA (uracil(1498)-N(3))-methyltransferase [Rhodobacteraceae bacterium Araon29]
MTTKIRLFVDQPLGTAQSVELTREQAHYLFSVMRLSVGTSVSLFNGRDGQWQAEIIEAGKRKGLLLCQKRTKALQMPPDLWFMFAPIKKSRTDFIVEKAAEMGAARILPIQTEFTNSERIRRDRLQAHAIEAAEQCGGTYVPKVEEMRSLESLLSEWPSDRHLLFCDEEKVGQASSLAGFENGPWAILIGPEGGFSHTERQKLNNLTYAQSIALGPRILRADTAAVAALTLWQTHLGDWS